MTNFGRSMTLAGLAASFFFTPAAHAQARDPAAAQALFDDARKLSAAGRYAEACEKLAESNRLDPGIGTQFHLADCQEKNGKIASAWANFLEVASLARASSQSDREKAALARAAKLESRLPKVQIDVPEASRVNGLEIRRNGILVGSAQWGTPLPADPGEHEIVASAPGKAPFDLKVRAELGKVAKLVIPALESDPNASSAPAAVPAVAATDSEPREPAAPDAGPTSSDDTGADAKGTNPLVFALAGVGVVGVGVGTVFALMANSTNDDSLSNCRPDDPNRCNQQGVDARDEARTQGNIATVGFLAGGAALLGAGAFLLFDGGSASERSAGSIRPSAELGKGRAALYVRGRF